MLATQCFRGRAHVFNSMSRGRGSYNLRMLWLASSQGNQNKVIKTQV